MIDRLIAETTECDFKIALETKKPKSLLKSVSAFANDIGGTLFGVSAMIEKLWAWRTFRVMQKPSAD